MRILGANTFSTKGKLVVSDTYYQCTAQKLSLKYSSYILLPVKFMSDGTDALIKAQIHLQFDEILNVSHRAQL